MARLYVTCTKATCGTRNDRTGGRRKCSACGTPLPKRRVPAHARTLRDVGYPEWEERSYEIHGGFSEYGACGVCGSMPKGNRHDRDHDHETGNIRGLACTGDFGCNRMMPRELTAERARAIARMLNLDVTVTKVAWAFSPYLPRDLTPERAEQIAAYLERVEAFYRGSET